MLYTRRSNLGYKILKIYISLMYIDEYFLRQTLSYKYISDFHINKNFFYYTQKYIMYFNKSQIILKNIFKLNIFTSYYS